MKTKPMILQPSKIIPLVFIGLAFSPAQGEENAIRHNTYETYPYVIEPLQEKELGKRKALFNKINNTEVKSPLNSFGYLTKIKNSIYDLKTLKSILAESKKEQEKLDDGKLEDIARDFVGRNKLFLGNPDIADLKAARISKTSSVSIVTFENQRHDGMEVIGTQMKVFIVGDTAINIQGTWYEEIRVPEKPQLSEDAIKKKLENTEITYRDKKGAPVSVTITQESLSSKAELVVMAKVSDKQIEFRQAWKIPVTRGMWTFYMDTVTGEELGRDQNFAT